MVVRGIPAVQLEASLGRRLGLASAMLVAGRNGGKFRRVARHSGEESVRLAVVMKWPTVLLA